MPRQLIEVTQEDIEIGEPGKVNWCPIAFALKKEFNQYYDVAVSAKHIRVSSKQYKTSLRVVRFIRAFDRGRPVKPFKFYLEELK